MGLFRRADYESAFASDEPSSVRLAAARLAALGQDLPFVPVRPYEHRWLQLGWRAVVLALLVLAAYFGTLGSESLWQDARVTSDMALRSWAGLSAIWADAVKTPLAPGPRTVNWLLGMTAGTGPMQFRLLSLGLHAATSILLWLLLRRLGVSGAWLAAAVLAIHPAVLPSVAWVSRQADLLGTACSMMGVWAYLRARDVRPALDEAIWTDPNYHADDDIRPRWPWALFAVSMLAGLTSGSIAAAAASLVLLAIDLTSPHRASRGLRAVLIVVAAVAISLVWWFARFPGPVKTETAVAAGASIAQLILPLELPFLWDRDQWPAGWTLITALVAAAALVLSLLHLRRAGGLCLLIALLLAIGHGALSRPPHDGAIVTADVIVYPALVVLVPIFVATLLTLATRPTRNAGTLAVRWGIGLLLISGLGTLTVLRSPAYATADALWQHTLAVDPNGVIAREELADRYLAQGFLDEAAVQLDRVPDPRRDTHWLIARGRAFEAQKRYSQAAACYETAHEREPANTEILIMLAEARSNAGQPEQAAALYAKALQRVTDNPGLLTNAGLAELRLGRHQAAADLYERALKIDPRFIPAHINLANALFELGQFEQSAQHLQEAVRIDPRNFPAFMNAGILLYRLKDHAKAERMFRAAINLDPTSPDAFDDLGIVLAAQGKLGDAAWSFTQATGLNPDHAAAEHLAAVRQQLRDRAATRPKR